MINTIEFHSIVFNVHGSYKVALHSVTDDLYHSWSQQVATNKYSGPTLMFLWNNSMAFAMLTGDHVNYHGSYFLIFCAHSHFHSQY
jgi:creatinine amidohydrolase/Fe(II)-dependent formamide hydrolase-like protein